MQMIWRKCQLVCHPDGADSLNFCPTGAARTSARPCHGRVRRRCCYRCRHSCPRYRDMHLLLRIRINFCALIVPDNNAMNLLICRQKLYQFIDRAKAMSASNFTKCCASLLIKQQQTAVRASWELSIGWIVTFGPPPPTSDIRYFDRFAMDKTP